MTATVWADTTDYSSTNSGLTRTDQIDLTGITDGAAQEGDEVDFGATLPARVQVRAGIEFASAPSSRTPIELYFHKLTAAGKSLPNGLTGSDGVYTGTAGSGSVEESLVQFYRVPLKMVTEDALVQYFVGWADATQMGRYSIPIFHNTSGVTLAADAVEMFIAVIPFYDETTVS